MSIRLKMSRAHHYTQCDEFLGPVCVCDVVDGSLEYFVDMVSQYMGKEQARLLDTWIRRG